MNIQPITSAIRSKATDEYTALIMIYEYIQKNVKYDYKELEHALKGCVTRRDAYTAHGALVDGYAVCQGFAEAFTLIAKSIGIECITVGGLSTIHSNKPVNHAWNIFTVKNKHYHADVTWDTNIYKVLGSYSYNYFALSDTEIMTDHEWDFTQTPPCTYSDMSYYVKNKLNANNKDQLEAIFIKAARDPSVPVHAKLSLNIDLPTPFEEAQKYLLQLLMKKASKIPGFGISVSGFWNENTRCFTARFEP
ncbi:MAG: hypothetical protein FWE11_06720 [Defluviitaleaceae bacterium]|nr:hypothetical protein [Defluviitaleaceae bacterium]